MIGRVLAVLAAAKLASAFDWRPGDTAESRRDADREEWAGWLGGLVIAALWLLERCL